MLEGSTYVYLSRPDSHFNKPKAHFNKSPIPFYIFNNTFYIFNRLWAQIYAGDSSSTITIKLLQGLCLPPAHSEAVHRRGWPHHYRCRGDFGCSSRRIEVAKHTFVSYSVSEKTIKIESARDSDVKISRLTESRVQVVKLGVAFGVLVKVLASRSSIPRVLRYQTSFSACGARLRTVTPPCSDLSVIPEYSL